MLLSSKSGRSSTYTSDIKGTNCIRFQKFDSALQILIRALNLQHSNRPNYTIYYAYIDSEIKCMQACRYAHYRLKGTQLLLEVDIKPNKPFISALTASVRELVDIKQQSVKARMEAPWKMEQSS